MFRSVYRLVGLVVKGATSQIAGSPAVLDRTVIVLDRTVIVIDRTIIVLDRTVIVLDRTIIVLDRIVIVLDRSVIAIYGILSLNFLRPGCGSDRLWLPCAARHTSAPALPTLSCLSGDRNVNKTLPRSGLFPGARSCAFKAFASRAADPRFDSRFHPGSISRWRHTSDLKLALQWLPCQALQCQRWDWSAQCKMCLGEIESLICSFSAWQHVQLSESIRPSDTLVCCRDVKQPTNKQTHFAILRQGSLTKLHHVWDSAVRLSFAAFIYQQFTRAFLEPQ